MFIQTSKFKIKLIPLKELTTCLISNSNYNETE